MVVPVVVVVSGPLPPPLPSSPRSLSLFCERLLCGALHLLLEVCGVLDAVVFKIALDAFQHTVQHLYTITRTTQHSSKQSQSQSQSQSPHSHPLLGLTQAQQAQAQATSGSNSTTLPPRLAFYAPLLHHIRLTLISHMAKPEEVIIVEDDNGQIVKETLKDSDQVTLYKQMREALIYLTHLSPGGHSAEVMLEQAEPAR